VVSQTVGTIAYSITPPNNNNEIFTINSDGTGLKQLTYHDGRDAGPSWSKDASKIAFYTHFDENNTWSIFVMDADGHNLQRLTNENEVWDCSPSWSPDGTLIVFARQYPLQNYLSEIWMMDADGGNQHHLNSVIGRGPEWSPDGSKIVFVSDIDGDSEIYVMDDDGNNIQKLTENNAEEWWPAWTPGGTQIICASNRDGNFEIYIMDADGQNQERLTNNDYIDNRPDCSPDGTQIAFHSDRDGHYEIYTMEINGSNQQRLTHTNIHAIQPAWRPITQTGIDESPDPGNSKKIDLTNVYPNPFTNSTTINYIINQTSHVRITITDSLGHDVMTLIDEYKGQGKHSIIWDGLNREGYHTSSGVYFVVMTTNEKSDNIQILKIN
ncbi:T9SS type A sorting domain-containing protein, partial [Bacteroidota bacterium]